MVKKESGVAKAEIVCVSDDSSSSSSSSSSGDSAMSEELRYQTELIECVKERNKFELELIQMNNAMSALEHKHGEKIEELKSALEQKHGEKIEELKSALEQKHGEKIKDLKVEMLQKEVKNMIQLKTLERERDLARIKCGNLESEMAELEKKTKEKPAVHCTHCAHCNGFGVLEEFIFADEDDGMLTASPQMEQFVQNIDYGNVRGGRDGDEEMMGREHGDVGECRQEETHMMNSGAERMREHGEVREDRRGGAEMMERRECQTVRHAEGRNVHFEMDVEQGYREPQQQVRPSSSIPVPQRSSDYGSNNNLNEVVNVETVGNLVHMEHEEEVVDGRSFAEVKTEDSNAFASTCHGESLRKNSKRTKDGFALYRKKKMEQLMGENPKMKRSEARSKISMLWRGLSDKTAAGYSALAETERKKCEENDRNKRVQVAEIEVITIDDSDDEV